MPTTTLTLPALSTYYIISSGNAWLTWAGAALVLMAGIAVGPKFVGAAARGLKRIFGR